MVSAMSLEAWSTLEAKPLNAECEQKAREHQLRLTKPPGSLGELETLAVSLASMQEVVFPACDQVHISVFAADHGVAARGVSAFPQVVTSQMVLNFAAGGAAISVLAKQLGADFEVINLGTVAAADHPDVIDRRIAEQTADFSVTEAMTEEEMLRAMDVGAEAIGRALSKGAQLFIAGEMGIANTTSASALMAALLNMSGESVAGPGTGIGAPAVKRKAELISGAIRYHQSSLTSPLGCLRCLGGFEIAAMVGAYLQAAHQGIPVLVDGFISSTAAFIACSLCEDAKQWMLFAHQSDEPFHQQILSALDVEPLLQLSMRLGEGSGAALAVNILRSACELHKQMATFEGAGVADH